MALTKKQEMFVLEYIKCLNATEAYKRAYGTESKPVTQKTAEVNGSRLLGNAEVKARIDEAMQEMKNDKIADAEEVLEFLTGMMRNPKVYPKDRIHSAELLGKRYSLWTEKIDMNATMEVEIVLDGFEDEEEE